MYIKTSQYLRFLLKCVSDNKNYVYLQFLGKEGLYSMESFPLAVPNNNYTEQSDPVWEGPFRQTSSFKSYQEQILTNFHQQENESIADQHARFTVLFKTCIYNQSCMNMHKADLFIHAVK